MEWNVAGVEKENEYENEYEYDYEEGLTSVQNLDLGMLSLSYKCFAGKSTNEASFMCTK